MDRPGTERLSPLATRSTHADWALIDKDTLDWKSAQAADNDRRREIHNYHDSHESILHRMLNAVEPGSYVRPHRHLAPPKDEGFIILRGLLGIVVFSDAGEVGELILLDPVRGRYGVDVRAGVWHTIVSLMPGTVVYEVKNGPYSPVDDKDFAPWGPTPEAPEAPAYLRSLEERFRSAVRIA